MANDKVTIRFYIMGGLCASLCGGLAWAAYKLIVLLVKNILNEYGLL